MAETLKYMELYGISFLHAYIYAFNKALAMNSYGSKNETYRQIVRAAKSGRGFYTHSYTKSLGEPLPSWHDIEGSCHKFPLIHPPASLTEYLKILNTCKVMQFSWMDDFQMNCYHEIVRGSGGRFQPANVPYYNSALDGHFKTFPHKVDWRKGISDATDNAVNFLKLVRTDTKGDERLAINMLKPFTYDDWLEPRYSI